MTITELIAQLEEYRKYMGDNAEVRITTRESEFSISGITTAEEINDVAGDDGDAVYIIQGESK